MLQLLDIFNQDNHLIPALESTRLENNEDAWLVEVDMPGVQKEDVQVQVSGAYLEIRGERKQKGKTFFYKEKFRLPFPLKSTEGITASMDLGVLKVSLPKSLSGVQSQLIKIA